MDATTSSIISAAVQGSAQQLQQSAALKVEKLAQDVEAQTAQQLLAVAEQSAPRQRLDPSSSLGLNIDVYA